jgi:hypothetical protein
MIAKLPQKAVDAGRSATFGIVLYAIYAVVCIGAWLSTEIGFLATNSNGFVCLHQTPATVTHRVLDSNH